MPGEAILPLSDKAAVAVTRVTHAPSDHLAIGSTKLTLQETRVSRYKGAAFESSRGGTRSHFARGQGPADPRACQDNSPSRRRSRSSPLHSEGPRAGRCEPARRRYMRRSPSMNG